MSCDPLKQNFKNYIAQSLFDDVKKHGQNRFFVSIGKSTPWVDSDGTTNDNFPPFGLDSVKNSTDFWRNCLTHKIIRADNVSMVIPRYDWQKGEIYDAYRDDIDLFNDDIPAKFYVLVDEERVYKCIDNNYGVASQVSPTHTDSQIRLLSDGYRWKYLYSITEDNRKFLTSSTTTNSGYMPVEFVEFLKQNDQRTLQFAVQNSAVTGSIDYIALDENIKGKIISDRVLFPYDGNTVVGTTASGSSTVLLGGSRLVPENNYYNGMILKFESGMGAGQQREITSYTYNANGTALAELKQPLNFAVTGGTSSDASVFSILPKVIISGDGFANNNTLNTYLDSADATIKFLYSATASTGPRYIDSIDIVHPGKNYTYADISFTLGLTFVEGTTGLSLSDLAKAVMPPIGGHGSNPVTELGSNSFMIYTDFVQSENGKSFTGNDFRQFALIKNPQLQEPLYKLYFIQPGVSASFTIGNGVTQGLTAGNGATGLSATTAKIVGWNAGTSGYIGTSELIVTNKRNGDFSYGGLINGFEIYDIMPCIFAGSQERVVSRLQVIPLTGSFAANTFINNTYIMGVGFTSSNVRPSGAIATVNEFDIDVGGFSLAFLDIENIIGDFKIGEKLNQFKRDYTGFTGPLAKIIEIDELEKNTQDVYDQTWKITLAYDGSNTFDGSSFTLDDSISCVSGSTEVATGTVLTWKTQTSDTEGILRLNDVHGNFALGNTVSYGNGLTSTIIAIGSTADILYNSGEILHLQNVKPISRKIDQREEIKLVIKV